MFSQQNVSFCLAFSLLHNVCDILQCPPLSVALYEVWGWARPPHDSTHLTTSDTETRAGDTWYNKRLLEKLFRYTVYVSDVLLPGGKQYIESMNYFWVFILLRSVTPVLIFVSVCHIIATTSCCSLLARCQHWPVSRQRHSGLATSNTCRENQAVDRDKPWIYEEKLTVTLKYRYSPFGSTLTIWVFTLWLSRTQILRLDLHVGLGLVKKELLSHLSFWRK